MSVPHSLVAVSLLLLSTLVAAFSCRHPIPDGCETWVKSAGAQQSILLEEVLFPLLYRSGGSGFVRSSSPSLALYLHMEKSQYNTQTRQRKKKGGKKKEEEGVY